LSRTESSSSCRMEQMASKRPSFIRFMKSWCRCCSCRCLAWSQISCKKATRFFHSAEVLSASFIRSKRRPMNSGSEDSACKMSMLLKRMIELSVPKVASSRTIGRIVSLM